MSVNSLRLSIAGLIAFWLHGVNLQAEDNPHLTRLGVDAWHGRGLIGNGVKVAVLDSGFRGYREHLGKALPQQVQTKSFRVDRNLEAKDSPHGLLCAETVHAIAPAAEILFANWEPDCPDSFLKAVRWCREQGATLFTCSIVMPGWSDGRGGGDVHRELHEILGNCLFFASAGNLEHRHWGGAFRDNGHGLHKWMAGCTENGIRPWGGQSVSVELTYDAASLYRLSVIDDLGRRAGPEQPLTARGVHGGCVRFVPEHGRTYRVKIERAKETSGELRLIVLGAELEMATSDGCMVFPGDGKEIVAVGAVSADGERLWTSSTGAQRSPVKPNCVAPVPVPSRIRATPFGGTSAAAPQAAAAAALLWSRDRQASAAVIAELLRSNCVDLGPFGPDQETGYGCIRLPKP